MKATLIAQLDEWSSGLVQAIQIFGPLGGLFVLIRLIHGFQKSILEGTVEQLQRTEVRLEAAEKRIASQERLITRQQIEIGTLRRALIDAGVEVPPPLPVYLRTEPNDGD